MFTNESHSSTTPDVLGKRSGSENHDDLYSRSDSDTDSEESQPRRSENHIQPPSLETLPGHRRNDSASRLHAEEEITDRFLATGKMTNFEEMERASARLYVQELVKVLPTMLESYSTLEADELMQKFSSDICAGKLSYVFLKIKLLSIYMLQAIYVIRHFT